MELKEVFYDKAADWNELAIHPHAVRAIEVGMVQCLTIAFTGNGDKTPFVEYYQGRGFVALNIEPCPCGNYGSPIFTCSCSIEDIATWQRQHRHTVDMRVDIPHVSLESLTKYLDGTLYSEPEEVMLNRVLEAREVVVGDISGDAYSLLKAAIKHWHPELWQVKSIIYVSKSVSMLGGSDTVGAAAMAEALQYTDWKNVF